MDDPILTPRGVGRYVTAADVADLKPSITDGDARLFIDGAGAREHTLQPRRVLDRPRPLQERGCITLSKPLRYCALGLFVAACLFYAYVLAVGAAFAALVTTFQGEDFMRSSESSSQLAPFTGKEGVSMMRWNSGATTNATATQNFTPSEQIDEIRVIAREPSTGNAVMAVVETFSPSNSGFAPQVINLASPLAA